MLAHSSHSAAVRSRLFIAMLAITLGTLALLSGLALVSADPRFGGGSEKLANNPDSSLALYPDRPFGGSTPTVSTTPCVFSWRNVQIPSPGSLYNELSSVAAISSNDVWAVGYQTSVSGSAQSLTLHWDGTLWTTIPSPNPSAFVVLQEVSAAGPNDVWAVGYSQNQSVAIHWDGSAWSVVSTPIPASPAQLNSVNAFASNDVWAVGLADGQTLVIHWNGTLWTLVPSPSVADEVNYLTSVDVIAVDNVWAAGYTYPPSSNRTPLVMHWNGAQWAIDTSLRSLSGYIDSISAYAPNDIWVAGVTNSLPLLYHWDGSLWSPVTVPDPGGTLSAFTSGTAVGTNDAWVVGYHQDGSNPIYTLAMRCNLKGCTIAPTEDPDANYNLFTSVSSLSADDVWAVGLKSNGARQTLSEHYGSPCAPIPTPSRTPTATPTACTLVFQDVQPPNVFYSSIRCLACLRILSGYQCGGPNEPCGPTGNPYFRPGNNVTRGQLAKIVSQAARFTDPVFGQTFQDVLPGSTFYTFTERLAVRLIMSGYTCGGPGEPCGGTNLPYFRPNSNATRGQISKIVANAKGLNGPPGAQIFEDVLPASVFYDYIQRLASLGYMNGYPCGGPGEPCVPSANRPYFRPGNLATRGQVSKIVSNAFFPDCNPPRK